MVQEPRINWDTFRTGLPYFDEAIENYKDRHRNYDMRMMWISPEDFKQYQHQAYLAKSDIIQNYLNRRRLPNDEPVFTYEEYWDITPDQNKVREIAGFMKRGDLFSSLVVEFMKDGTVSDFQEGRHRILAAESLGEEFVPVWMAERRFK